MARFDRNGTTLSGQVVTVNDDSFTVVLHDPVDTVNDASELQVTSTRNPGVTPVSGKLIGGNAPTSGREWVLQGITGMESQIDAVPKSGGTPRDSFFVRFGKKTGKPPIFVKPIEDTMNWSGANKHLIPTVAHAAKIIDWTRYSISRSRLAFVTASSSLPFAASLWLLASSKEMQFQDAPNKTARKGVFSVTQGSFTRAILLLLPETGTPDTLLIGIEPKLFQSPAVFKPLGWTNPLSIARGTSPGCTRVRLCADQVEA
jgi:hypothetical protein